MKKEQPSEPEKSKNKGGRPKKKAELHEGDTAAKRFAAGLRFAIKGGQQ